MVWDPVACMGELGFSIVSQPGQLRELLIAGGKKGAVRVIYQPKQGDLVEHWEHVCALCVKAQNLILVADEVDMICSAGSPNNATSGYWKKFQKTPGLETIVQFGRHSHIAFVGVARAPQDVWRRLTGQSNRILVFRMNERLELEAVRGRLGAATDELPHLGEYEYLDWTDDGNVSKGGGRK